MQTITASLFTLALVFSPMAAEAAGRSITGQSVHLLATGWGAEGIYVRTVDEAPIIDGCGGSVYLIAPSHPLLKEMVAMLMFAFQNQIRVDFYVEGCNAHAMYLMAVTIHR